MLPEPSSGIKKVSSMTVAGVITHVKMATHVLLLPLASVPEYERIVAVLTISPVLLIVPVIVSIDMSQEAMSSIYHSPDQVIYVPVLAA